MSPGRWCDRLVGDIGDCLRTRVPRLIGAEGYPPSSFFDLLCGGDRLLGLVTVLAAVLFPVAEV